MQNQQDEILWGVAAIGAALNRSEVAVYHLLSRDQLPAVKKIGGRWCAKRSNLLAMFDSQADSARQPDAA